MVRYLTGHGKDVTMYVVGLEAENSILKTENAELKKKLEGIKRREGDSSAKKVKKIA